MGIIKGKANLLFFFSYFVFVLHGGSTLKGKNLLLVEQILSFKSRSPFGRALSTKQTANQELFPFAIMVENHWGVPIHLKNGLYLITGDGGNTVTNC